MENITELRRSEAVAKMPKSLFIGDNGALECFGDSMKEFIYRVNGKKAPTDEELDILSDWIKTTETGSRSDLSFLPSE